MEWNTIRKTAKVVVMPGDGVGPEVTYETVKVIQATDADIKFYEYSVGGEEYIEGGNPLPLKALRAVDQADAVLLGAIGHEKTPYEIPRKVLIYLRVEKDAYANLRPLKVYKDPSDTQCKDVDVVICRDNSEGSSLQHTGKLEENMGTDRHTITNYGAKRIVKYAYEYAVSKN